jgi:pullulanase
MALAPQQYFRFRPDGTPSDGSRCGNEFRSESPEGRRFIVESCKFWVNEYAIDGFRFDLMGLIDRDTMRLVASELRAIDPSILVYGEPWAAGPTIIDVNGKGAQRGRGWGAFNDDFRDGFRGEVFKPKDPGFLAAGRHADRCKKGIVGGVMSWTDSPLECINYLECHDNHTLADRLALTTPPETRVGYRQRTEMNLMGALALFTSQGVPFIHSGQEFGRSKDGEDNTYNLGDQINNIRWHDKADRHAIFNFYRALIRLRREHPMFRLASREQVLAAVKFLDDDLRLRLPEGTLAWQVTDPTSRDPWAVAIVALNGAHEPRTIPLPAGVWSLAVLDGQIHDGSRSVTGSLELPPHQGALLCTPR